MSTDSVDDPDITNDYSTVIVPVDFSADTDHAFQVGLAHAKSPESVHLIHVLYPLDFVSPGVLIGDVTESERETQVESKFAELKQRFDAPHVVTNILLGDPGTQICEYADAQSAELIIVPSHGYHGLKRLFLGSVAERVIRHAHCSVLVLRRGDAD
ncbi:universal stress protein [Stratiformator vulcanicus]|uniref:Universal stress protein n=1 Tax=Stratiformator vulcanicus TaxID=2527980 RepID=A0A517R335_9PLAN|nr:universal stress protein [Stratiformator vulcanicus]QDT38292.1 Putative universal stress protein [Stratiformator vulcanicus]